MPHSSIGRVSDSVWPRAAASAAYQLRFVSSSPFRWASYLCQQRVRSSKQKGTHYLGPEQPQVVLVVYCALVLVLTLFILVLPFLFSQPHNCPFEDRDLGERRVDRRRSRQCADRSYKEVLMDMTMRRLRKKCIC